MTNAVHIRDPKHLDSVNGLIHDCWFCRDQVALDENRAELRIPFERPLDSKSFVVRRFGFLTKTETPVASALLLIRAVREWFVEDPEGVGSYDFNDLTYDPDRREIIVRTGVPIKIRIVVKEVDILVDVSESIVRKDRSWRLFW